MTKWEAVILRVFALWTVWVWGTRIGNVINDDSRSAGFKLVHIALAAVSVILAAAALWVVRGNRRRIRSALPDDSTD